MMILMIVYTNLMKLEPCVEYYGAIRILILIVGIEERISLVIGLNNYQRLMRNYQLGQEKVFPACHIII